MPGYRGIGKTVPPADPGFLERAWSVIAASRREGEHHGRSRHGTLRRRRDCCDRPGDRSGRIDRGLSGQGPDRSLGRGYLHTGLRPPRLPGGPLTFGVAICHEGWRYPETVRWAARHGAQLVFHPHFHEAEPGCYRPATFADPANTFHEKAALCRAAENTCYFATVNYASAALRPRRRSCVRTGRCSATSPTGGRVARRRHRSHHGDRLARGTLQASLTGASRG